MNKKPILCFSLGILLFISILPFQNVNSEPTFSSEFGSSGNDNDEFNDPTGIAISSNGNSIYVADTDNNRIGVFDEDGDPDFNFGSLCNMSTDQGCHDNSPNADEDGDGQFNKPSDVTIDSFGDIYVVDSENDRIQRFDDDGDFESKFGSSNSNDQDYLGTPTGIAIQKSTRDIYVTSTETDSISVFDLSGNFLFKFGSLGSGEGKFRNPSYMIIDDSEEILYVADTDNDRIQIFELVDSNTCPQGTQEIVDGVCFVEEFGSTGTDEGEFISPMGLALDITNDLLYVADSINDRIQIFELVDSNTCPQGTQEIVDGVCFVEEFGSAGSTSGKFSSPSDLALDATNDLLYVTDTANHRIQVFKTSETTNKKPDKPTDVTASAASPTSIVLTWQAPTQDTNSPQITGFKIEYKIGSDNFSTLVADTKSTNISFLHEGLKTGETYTYRVYAINSIGTSVSSTQSSAKPQTTTVPSGLIAIAISPNQIMLSWNAPSETFGQQISGYTIKRQIVSGVYETISETSGGATTYTVNNLATGKTYTYVVNARFPLGSSDISNAASATPTSSSKAPSGLTVSTPPTGLSATAVSPVQIDLKWNYPSNDGGSPITGYKIDVKTGDGNFVTLIQNTDSSARTYSHTGRTADITYTYKLYAINSAGISSQSNEASATPTAVSTPPTTKEKPSPPLSTVATTISQNQINLSWKPPANDGGDPVTGYKIEVREGSANYKILSSNVGKNTAYSHTGLKASSTYYYRVSAINSIGTSFPSAEIAATTLAPEKEPEPEPKIPDFVDATKGAQYYLDRYNNEPAYKAWFDNNFPDYTIKEAIELKIPGAFSEPKEVKSILPFVDPKQDPQYYIDRYNSEPTYKAWFDNNFPDYTIYEAVGVKQEKSQIGICGPGTVFVNGFCESIKKSTGGCLIATATFGTELAPQVQELRELRDNTLLETNSGTSFMNGFNKFYYSFSPTIADWERANPIFKEAVKLTITPLLASLSILNYVDIDSEEEILGYGIGVILINIGMYIIAPLAVITKFRRYL